MKPVRLFSASEQVAFHVKSLILQGEIRDSVPGVALLAKSLGVNTKTVVSALEILEKEGILLNQGPRRKRLIDESQIDRAEEVRLQGVHLNILLYEPSDRQTSYLIELQHALSEAGHAVTVASKTLMELKMDLGNVEKLVQQEDCDAWLVVAGSREVLQWFLEQPRPAFALFGRRTSLPIASAGPKSNEAVLEGIEHLLAQGHRRIVKICRRERRLPQPGVTERKFLALLEGDGIQVGDYNLPDWEESAAGLQELMRSLFRVTPPTALIFDEAPVLIAAWQFLGSKGLRVPEDVSLLLGGADSVFDWCSPPVTCVTWPIEPVIRRVVKWANNVANGKEDLERSFVSATLQMGGTIVPVRGE